MSDNREKLKVATGLAASLVLAAAAKATSDAKVAKAVHEAQRADEFAAVQEAQKDERARELERQAASQSRSKNSPTLVEKNSRPRS